MLVEDVVRRNRRRIALVTVVALLNYWVFTAVLLALPVGLRLVARLNVTVPVAVGLCLALAAPFAVKVLAGQVRGMDARTLDELGAVTIGPGELPVVENLLQELAIAVGAPPVRAALVADDAPNALAVGRRPAPRPSW